MSHCPPPACKHSGSVNCENSTPQSLDIEESMVKPWPVDFDMLMSYSYVKSQGSEDT